MALRVASVLNGLAAGLIMIVAQDQNAVAEDQETSPTSAVESSRRIVLPMIDAERGRRLFVAKGCFLCHAINGAGGEAAPALDATEGVNQLDLMNFVARMWAGASAMLELQSLELGYQIELSGDEIADLAAFAGDADAQQAFTTEEIPEVMRDWLIERPYWLTDDWPETFEQEFHENGLPLDYE